jgi:uncharacterized protein YjiS (DUF1127 family)
MSTLFSIPVRMPRIRPSPCTDEYHQSSSWQSLGRIRAALTLWHYRVRQRAELRHIAEDRHLLSDIGLSRAQALYEADKPFWH